MANYPYKLKLCLGGKIGYLLGKKLFPRLIHFDQRWLLFFSVVYDYLLDGRFFSFLDCLKIGSLRITQPHPLKSYGSLHLPDLLIIIKFMVWIKLQIK